MSQREQMSNDSQWYRNNLEHAKRDVNTCIASAKAKQQLSTRCLVYPRFMNDCKAFFESEGYRVSDEFESDYDCSYSYIVVSWDQE